MSGYRARVSITRTADTNAYGAGDVVGAATGSTAAVRFEGVGQQGSVVEITSVAIMIEATGLIASEAGYTLHLYDATPPSALGDNAPWDLPSGDRDSYLGTIALGTPVDVGSTIRKETNAVGKVIRLRGTSLFGYLVTDAAHTPTSARVYRVEIHTKAP